MDFILRTIEKKIRRFEGSGDSKIYYQVRVEYSFYLLLAYFWNKNFEEIGIRDFVAQGNIINEIQRPSIGSIASIIQKLDINKELSKNIDSNIILSDYAELRNDLIGHGYSFEDDLENFSTSFDQWYQKLLDLRIPILSRKVNLIICQGFDEKLNEFFGTIYDFEGDVRSNWRCSSEISDFEIGNLYASYESNLYFRLSPFIHIESKNDELYVFRSVQQPLLGKIRYNRIDSSNADFTKCWEEFEIIANNGIIKKNPNGSVINVFNPNYKKYIEIGSIKDKVYEFLIGKEKNSSVCITLWGHGGNGKTATVQKICEELSINEKRPFEFIFFLSAKDRELNKYTGQIVSINKESRITTFEELIEKLNLFLYSESSFDFTKIANDKSRILFVIDDYETFEDADKEKITLFIKQLNTNYHKVIITTRNSFLKIGDEIQTNELDQAATIKFLMELLVNDHAYTELMLSDVQYAINKGNTKEEIHKLTLGKPIEIIRFVNCFVQKGKLTDELLREISKLNTRSERIEFLYGRNYKQLSGDKLAQDIFVVIGLLTPQDTITSLISHIKLILNIKEEDSNSFNSSLDKLVKLRLLEIDDDGSYRVDSKDILEIMKAEYNKRDNNFKRFTTSVYEKIKTNITADTDRALLNHVKSLRHQSNPETTIQQYKEILRQGADFSYDIKLEALFDLSDFLFNNRGDKEAAVKLFDDYFDKFYEFNVLKRYASYTWSIEREKAIKILENFYSKYFSRNISLNKNQKLHLLGLIVLREGLFWNDRFERDFQNKNKVKEELTRIYKVYGHILLNNLRINSLINTLNSEELNDISLALETLVDVCYRINNKIVADDICNLALEKFPERFNSRFKRKRDKLGGFRNTFKPSRPQNNYVSDLGEKLKTALNQIDIINLEVAESGYNGVVLKKYNEPTKYGYIKLTSNEIKGRVYFRDICLKNINFNDLKEGDNVRFGFGKITSVKFGAINVSK